MPPGTKIFDWEWVFDNLDVVWVRIVQHLQLTVIPLALGIVISLVLAIIAVRRPVTYGPVTAITGLLYTIPSLAAFAFLGSIYGLSLVTAIIPLTTYTLLILFRNFVAGFNSVPHEILEAAEGMGYTRRERLVRVELPLAVPLIIAGIRLASVTVIGLATVAAVLGDAFGGLGQLITEGIQSFFPTEYLLGAFLSVVLAITADVGFVQIQRILTPWARARTTR
jgi:osmoprotectant transport system permease protein